MLKKPIPLEQNMALNGFDSTNIMLDSWLIKHAKQAQSSGSARTYVVSYDNSVVGFYSLVSGQVENIEAPVRVAKDMGNYPIPVIILARLAVRKDYQGQGIGWRMLKDAIKRVLCIADEVGVRAILTHPIDDRAESFYKNYGFEHSPIRERQLFLLLKDARRVISG